MEFRDFFAISLLMQFYLLNDLFKNSYSKTNVLIENGSNFEPNKFFFF